jgi:nucleoside-diphosphate-sugar epimerase
MGKVLIVGASGVVGSAALERFLLDDDREIVAVSRRKPDIDAMRPFRHLPCDLRQTAAAREALAGLHDVEDLATRRCSKSQG